MSQFFISCKESRIENNRSFYGCFYLGSFEPSQSITIANTLRRTLLSEIYGCAIISVEIEGASHEYSNLPGVRESVLDILLNLKEIVLKKTIKNFTPQIGYLRARGPGVVSASHLRLPPFIQCVDPDQYIAHLSEDGFLNIKFLIQYGKKWLTHLNSLSELSQEKQDSKETSGGEENLKRISLDNVRLMQHELSKEKKLEPIINNAFQVNLKKRRFFLTKLKKFGIPSSNSYLNLFFKKFQIIKQKITKKRKEKLITTLKLANQYPGINFKGLSPKVIIPLTVKTNNISLSEIKEFVGANPIANELVEFNSNILKKKPKTFSIFTNKTPHLLINRKHKTLISSKSTSLTSKSSDSEGVQNTHRKNVGPKYTELKSKYNSTKKNFFFNSNTLNIEAIFNPINKVNYIIEINDFKMAQRKNEKSFKIEEIFRTFKTINNSDYQVQEIEQNNDPISSTSPTLKNFNHSVHNRVADPLFLIAQGQKSLVAQNLLKLENSIRSSNNEQNIKSPRESSKKALQTFQHDFFGLDSKGLLQEKKEFENLLHLNDQIQALNNQKIKHNVILEIWTNGSIHPRDALYQAFKNLITLFSKLQKTQPIGIMQLRSDLTNHDFNGLDIENLVLPQQFTNTNSQEDIYNEIELNKSSVTRTKINRFLLKKIKFDELRYESSSNFLEDLIPFDEKSFLSTYLSPKVKNYYLNKQTLSLILKISQKKKNFTPFLIN
jgi:DNA-directed RNA polymerase alpha subunit